MSDVTRENDSASTGPTPAASSPKSTGHDESRAPEFKHTTANPSAIPKARPFALAAWLTIPLLIVLLLLVGLFMVPGMGANTEDKDPPRHLNDSEQSRPE